MDSKIEVWMVDLMSVCCRNRDCVLDASLEDDCGGREYEEKDNVKRLTVRSLLMVDHGESPRFAIHCLAPPSHTQYHGGHSQSRDFFLEAGLWLFIHLPYYLYDVEHVYTRPPRNHC